LLQLRDIGLVLHIKQREREIKMEYWRDYFYCIHNEELEK